MNGICSPLLGIVQGSADSRTTSEKKNEDERNQTKNQYSCVDSRHFYRSLRLYLVDFSLKEETIQSYKAKKTLIGGKTNEG